MGGELVVGEPPAVQANVGHGDDLPEGAARDRAKGEHAARGYAAAVDQIALPGHLQSWSQGIGPREAAREQVPDQRIARRLIICLRARAVDRPSYLQVLDRRRTAPAHARQHRSLGGLDGDDPRCADGELPTLHSRFQLGRDARRHAMPVDLPPWAQVTQKPAPLLDRQPPQNPAHAGVGRR